MATQRTSTFNKKKTKQIKTEVYQHLYHSTFDQVWTNFNSPSKKMDTESQIHSDTYVHVPYLPVYNAHFFFL